MHSKLVRTVAILSLILAVFLQTSTALATIVSPGDTGVGGGTTAPVEPAYPLPFNPWGGYSVSNIAATTGGSCNVTVNLLAGQSNTDGSRNSYSGGPSYYADYPGAILTATIGQSTNYEFDIKTYPAGSNSNANCQLTSQSITLYTGGGHYTGTLWSNVGNTNTSSGYYEYHVWFTGLPAEAGRYGDNWPGQVTFGFQYSLGITYTGYSGGFKFSRSQTITNPATPGNSCDFGSFNHSLDPNASYDCPPDTVTYVSYYAYDPRAQVQVNACPEGGSWTLSSANGVPYIPGAYVSYGYTKSDGTTAYWPSQTKTYSGTGNSTLTITPDGDGYTTSSGLNLGGPGSTYTLSYTPPAKYDVSITPAPTQVVYAWGSNPQNSPEYVGVQPPTTIYSATCTLPPDVPHCPDGSVAPNKDVNQCVCSGANLQASPNPVDSGSPAKLSWSAGANCTSGVITGGQFDPAGIATVPVSAGNTSATPSCPSTTYTFTAYNGNKSSSSTSSVISTVNNCAGCTGSCSSPFTYMLTSQPPTLVLNLLGNASGVETIYKVLTSGSNTSRAVSLSLNGVPNGVSYSNGVGSNCSPDCNTDISFSANADATVGQYTVTVTGSPNDMKTAFTLSIVKSLPVTCSASPTTARINSSVTYSASASGGTPPYTYSWSGSEVPTSPAPSANPYSITYKTIGKKSATVFVKDSNGGSGSCTSNAQVDFNSSFKEI